MPCNPLKSIDSDERIQGNPRQSNPMSGGFRSERARAKKIQTDRPDQRCAPPPNGAKPTPSKGKAPKPPLTIRATANLSPLYKDQTVLSRMDKINVFVLFLRSK
jgi:hypothetical protein